MAWVEPSTASSLIARAFGKVPPLVLGIAAAALAVVGGEYPGAAIAALFAIPLVTVIVMRPRVGVLLLILLLGYMEEFPGGLSDQEVERSTRTPFYATALGLPAMYPPDVMVMVLFALYFARKVLLHENLGLRLDKIGIAMLLMVVSMAISVMLGFTLAEPLGPPILDLSIMAPLKLPEAVARLIAVLQIKLFAMLFAGYLLGLLYFRNERDIRDMVVVVGFAMVLTLCLGAVRLAQDPSLVRKTIAVVYDSATVTLMALTVFYIVGKWSCSYYRPWRAVLLAVFCAALAILILLSFRRAMWGGIAGAMLVFPLLLPGKARTNVFLLVGVGLAIGAVIVGIAGEGLVDAALARVGETNFQDASTLYRFALAIWAVERFADLPLFGWGLKPLWNETIRIRFFLANMENVHSIYVWVLIRFGLAGLFMFAAAVILVFARIAEVRRILRQDSHRVLVAVIVLFILLVLFSGIFNPVYSSVRAMLPLGIALGLISRLPEIAAAGEAAK